MSLYANLSPDQPLLDSDDASRYCQPNEYDRIRCEPKVAAFQRKPSQPDVSVNRLQFFQLPDRGSAIDCVRQEFLDDDYRLRKNGRFVVLNVGSAKAAALEVGYPIEFTYTPKPTRPSHSSILKFPTDPNGSRTVATAIKRLVTRDETYCALP